ncbi:hypothetical protein [Actinomadura madurae]|uniref:hypothetical protein n=1 Tax=Actinomadura madurae TaxID=1993 RepID=UPI0011BDEE04|nr:hypothetical protein [Actinomadura madurae]
MRDPIGALAELGDLEIWSNNCRVDGTGLGLPLEHGLMADFALVRAARGDPAGNDADEGP